MFKIKTVISLLVLAAVIVFAAVCTDNKGTSSGGGDFEVHEWGVLLGCAADTSFFLTSRPEMAPVVREPVIYIHSDNRTPFTIRAFFNSGNPTDTYPGASLIGNAVIWNNVGFADSLIVAKPAAPADPIPLDSIKAILNDVDSDILEYNGETTRFLFYEGQVDFQNRIEVTMEYDPIQATFFNGGEKTVYHLVMASDLTMGLPPIVIGFGRVESLSPGEEITVPISSETEIDFAADLISRGFTFAEAQAFSLLWQNSFLNPYNCSNRWNVVYRLSEEEYDEIISLQVLPQPSITIRSLYVMVHAPI
jgi:hypothetical protein